MPEHPTLRAARSCRKRQSDGSGSVTGLGACTLEVAASHMHPPPCLTALSPPRLSQVTDVSQLQAPGTKH